MRIGLRRKVKRYRRELLLALICLVYVLLKVTIFSNGLAFYDEGVYTSTGKFFASWGSKGSLEMLRPLALPFVLIPSQMLPLNGFITARIMGVLLTLACILLVHYSAAGMFGKKAGLWSAALFAGSALVVQYGGYVLTDVVCYTIALLAVSFAVQKRYFLTGLFAGVSFLFKFPAILVVIPLGLFILLTEKERIKGALMFALGAAVGTLPYFLFNLLSYQGSMAARLFGPLLHASEVTNTPAWYVAKASVVRYVTVLFTHEGVLLGLSLFGLYYYFRRKRDVTALLLGCIIMFLAYFFFDVARFDERYLLSAIPFLAVLAGAGVARFVSRRKEQYVAGLLVIIIIVPALCMTAYLAGHIAIKNDRGVEKALMGQKQGVFITNTGFSLFYPPTKAELYPGPNMGETYLQYRLDENASALLMAADEYPCYDERCVILREKRMNKIASSNNLSACGMLHGQEIVMVNKDEGKISREECLNALGYPLEQVRTETFFRLNTSLSELQEERNIPQLVLLLSLLKEDDVGVYVVLRPENYVLTHKQRLMELLDGAVLGATPSEGSNMEEFIMNVEKDLGKNITFYVPPGDEWKGNMSMPEGMETCIVGAWELSFPEKSCKKVDLYPNRGSGSSEPLDAEELIRRYDALTESDYEVGVTFNIFSPEDEEYWLMLALAHHIDQKRRDEIAKE